MKNLVIFIVTTLLCLTVVFSCSREELAPNSTEPEQKAAHVDTGYDIAVSEIAFAVHQSFDISEFTKALKDEIMRKSDGDYEVIIKNFLNRNASLGETSLFQMCLTNAKKGSDKDSSIIEMYPRLQISIPVHADKWDGVSKLWILYPPEDFNESTTKEVPAISPDGIQTTFNIEKQPSFPVMVVSQNERSNKNGDLRFAYNMLKEKVQLKNPESKYGEGGFTSFSATPVTNAMAVNLVWTLDYPYELEPYDHYFAIFRDDLEGYGFQKIGEAYAWQNFFVDYNVFPTKTYDYYVVAYVDIYQTYNHDQYLSYYWSPLDEAAIPQIPGFANNFSVDCIGPGVMELRWSINNISNWTNLEIRRYHDYNTTPVIIASLPLTTVYYQDILVNPNPAYGNMYTYILHVYNVNTGVQQDYFCQEMLSNRISNQSLKVKRIQFNTFDDMRRYESWLNGAPEVMLSVFKVINNSPQTICSNIEIGGPASSGFDCNYPICQWAKTDANAYTISLNEYDGGESGGLDVSLALTAKIPKIFGVELSTTFGVKGTLFKRNRDDYIGSGYLYYWNNAAGKAVYCGNYCRATLVSEQD